ncbi:hypothetical protein N7474_005235 [Penicillium riverlandense]|uniref:uncharacterized protein n=1 Tax=Penicillium riverlandense TaxID=1903569 RepID=UPI002546D431|nr:uncharacterized protein N7474_005235 [Penicillium riverlandense]KAJ5819644.1 hypothetical protein N7474_005235 [Penicillium riverlandense]
MPPRGFTNPAPKTESARSALSSFTCTLCNKSYSRHPEYEAHISSYDHQHRKRLQDLKQLSRDPNAAEKARRAERKADADAGLRVIDKPGDTAASNDGKTAGGGRGGGGFKKGGFKSSFATVKGTVAPASVTRKNVLGDDGDEDDSTKLAKDQLASSKPAVGSNLTSDAESDTDEDYYDPRRPTDCFTGCASMRTA